MGFEEILAFQAIAGRDITQNNADELVSIKDLINTTYGLETVMIAADVSDDELLGQFVIESELHDDVNSVPDNAVYLLDRKKIGRLQREIDGGIFINDFYIVAENMNGLKYMTENLSPMKNLPSGMLSALKLQKRQ